MKGPWYGIFYDIAQLEKEIIIAVTYAAFAPKGPVFVVNPFNSGSRTLKWHEQYSLKMFAANMHNA